MSLEDTEDTCIWGVEQIARLDGLRYRSPDFNLLVLFLPFN